MSPTSLRHSIAALHCPITSVRPLGSFEAVEVENLRSLTCDGVTTANHYVPEARVVSSSNLPVLLLNVLLLLVINLVNEVSHPTECPV